ncbi:endoribonuclease Dicer [Pseudohyphozyma bogoriensis]|nr:endoribonuclease Dicer [Pseudohyphozyma bogoriensis]
MSDDPLVPRVYQTEALRRALEGNVVIRADTGSGKTLIAILLIRHITSTPVKASDPRKLIFFVVPSVPLVTQQANVLRQQTSLRVKQFIGADGVDFWQREKWQQELERADVVVLTAQILCDMLRHSYWSMDKISLIVFDEAHHCRKRHAFNQIMAEHYHPALEKGSPVPKILGLTASAVFNPTNPEKSLKELESNLAAKIVELETEEFSSSAPPTTESLVFYEQEETLDLTPTRVEALAQASGIVELRGSKFLNNIELTKSELGRAVSDIFITQFIRDLAQPRPGQDPDDRSQLLKLLSLIGPELPFSLDDASTLSPKLHRLIEVLVESRECDDFRAILFVDRRVHAEAISEALRKVPVLAGWTKVESLLGHGGREGEDRFGMTPKQQEETVTKFRSGEVNVLVATKVAEEGLDFRHCCLVVRIDPIQTLVGYIQSRGRARAKNSRFVVLSEEGSEAATRYRSYLEAEPEMKKATLGREDADVDEPDLPGLPTFVTATKAILTYASAIPLLNSFLSLLPCDDFSAQPKAEYAVVNVGSSFQATVTLPMIASLPTLRSANGQFFPTKKAAKQSAAFKVCKALYEAGGLDDHLLPVRERRGEGARDADGATISSDKCRKWVETSFDNVFGDPEQEDLPLWLSVVQVAEPGRPPFHVGLVSSSSLPTFSDGHFFKSSPPAPEIQTVDVALISSRPLALETDLRRERIKKLVQLNRDCIIVWLNRRLPEAAKLHPLWAPVVHVSTSASPSFFDVDWAQVDSAFSNPSPTDLIPDTVVHIRLPRVQRRVMRVVKVRTDVNSLSPALEIEPSADSHRQKFMAKYGGFVALVKKYYRYDASETTPETIVHLQEVREPPITTQLVRRLPPDEMPLTRPIEERNYPIGMLSLTTLSQDWIDFVRLMPSVLRVVHDRARATAVVDHFKLPSIRPDLLINALTNPACNVGYDYQSLETFGDSVLKLATTVHVYLQHPTFDEGRMATVRQNSVDNRFLRLRSLAIGFAGFTINEVYRTKSFIPCTSETAVTSDKGTTFTRMVSRKVLSDTIESTLGAAYLTGGLRTALETGDRLGLCFGGSVPWGKRQAAKALVEEGAGGTPAGFVKIQQDLGYAFRDARLLLRAMTHRSFVGADSHCYEREEHLGDAAVLDFWATYRLFELFPDLTPRRLTFLRALLVSNVTLAFLSLRVLRVDKTIRHSSSTLDAAIKAALAEIEGEEGYTWSKILEDLTWTWDAPKVLGDVFEAVLGAIFVDSAFNLEAVYKVLDKIYEPILPLLRDIEKRDPYSDFLMLKDARHCRCLKIRVTPIKNFFEAVATFHDNPIATQRASTRAVARQVAAQDALKVLRPGSDSDDDGVWAKCDCGSPEPKVEVKEGGDEEMKDGGEGENEMEDVEEGGTTSALKGKKRSFQEISPESSEDGSAEEDTDEGVSGGLGSLRVREY